MILQVHLRGLFVKLTQVIDIHIVTHEILRDNLKIVEILAFRQIDKWPNLLSSYKLCNNFMRGKQLTTKRSKLSHGKLRHSLMHINIANGKFLPKLFYGE
jgi:hypothetical protein